MKTGIIILSHGSRVPQAQETLRDIMAQVGRAGNFDVVEEASLQFNEPDLPTAIATTAGRGVDRIIVVPLFLYNGMHMKMDIPEIVAEVGSDYPGVEIVVTRNIGADPKLVEILLDRIGEVK